MAVQDFKDPDTTVNEFSNNLSAEELAKSRQQLLSGISSLGYDLAPVTGEFRSLQYAQDESRNLVSNILSENPDKLKMVAQGLGVGLGILGAIPIVGYGTRITNRGLQKLYETLEIRGDGYVIDSLLDLAKAMHKKECVDLLNHHNDIFDTSEEHYNKTFGGNNEQQ